MISPGDIQLDVNFNIFGINGDLATGEVPEQHIGAILNAAKGNFRRYPTLGADIMKQADGLSNSRDIVAIVQNELYKDGWRLDDIEITAANETIEITVKQATKTTDNTKNLI